MSDLTETYAKHFDSVRYAKEYFGEVDYELQWLPEDIYHELFSTEKLRGKTLLDVGCGPTVRAAISASGYVAEIYLCDLVESNREEVKKWLRNEPGHLDFTAEFKHVAELEGKDDIQYLEDRVRKAVKDVWSCNILDDDPLKSQPLQQFDIVTSCYCVECNTDYKNYIKAVNNIARLVRPGGHLVLLGALNCTTYPVGDKHFPGYDSDLEHVRRSVEGANLEILDLKEHKYKDALTIETDCKGVTFVSAYKPK